MPYDNNVIGEVTPIKPTGTKVLIEIITSLAAQKARLEYQLASVNANITQQLDSVTDQETLAALKHIMQLVVDGTKQDLSDPNALHIK